MVPHIEKQELKNFVLSSSKKNNINENENCPHVDDCHAITQNMFNGIS